MKKFLTSMMAILAISSFSASAQNKGDIYVGGIAGINISGAKVISPLASASEIAAGIGIAPEFGYFVTNRLKIGATATWTFSASTHAITIGPNLAYYVRLCDGLYYTPGIEICFAYGATDDYNMPGLGAGLRVLSLEFRPTQHFGFEVNMMSLSYVVLNKDGLSSNSFNAGLGVNPSIGLKYYF